MVNLFPEETWHYGGPVDHFTVGIYLFGDELNPDEITLATGVIPSQAYRKGDLKGPSTKAMYETGGWLLRYTGHVPDTPQDGLERLLVQLQGKEVVWRELQRRHRGIIRIGIYMDSTNRSFILGSDALARVAALGMDVELDMYGP